MIMKLLYEMNDVFQIEKITEENLQLILDIELQVAITKKKYKHKVETKLMDYISYFPLALFDDDDEIALMEGVEGGVIAGQLTEFAQKLFEINISRDSFSGIRRGLGLSLEALKNGRKTQLIAVTDALQEYYKIEEIQPEDEIIELINKRYSKAKTKEEVMACLSFLTETAVISEYEALSMLDNWKEKHDYW